MPITFFACRMMATQEAHTPRIVTVIPDNPWAWRRHHPAEAVSHTFSSVSADAYLGYKNFAAMTWDELTDLLAELGAQYDVKVHVVKRDGLDTVALHLPPWRGSFP